MGALAALLRVTIGASAPAQTFTGGMYRQVQPSVITCRDLELFLRNPTFGALPNVPISLKLGRATMKVTGDAYSGRDIVHQGIELTNGARKATYDVYTISGTADGACGWWGPYIDNRLHTDGSGRGAWSYSGVLRLGGWPTPRTQWVGVGLTKVNERPDAVGVSLIRSPLFRLD